MLESDQNTDRENQKNKTNPPKKKDNVGNQEHLPGMHRILAVCNVAWGTHKAVLAVSNVTGRTQREFPDSKRLTMQPEKPTKRGILLVVKVNVGW